MKIQIDLRPKMLPVRDQKTRPTCLAFSASSAHEWKHAMGEHLSPEHLYQQVLHHSGDLGKKRGLRFDELPFGLTKQGQTTEIVCPYDVGWTFSTGMSLSPIFRSGVMDDLVSFDEMVVQLKNSRVPVVGFALTSAFQQIIDKPYVIDDSYTEEVGKHAMNIVGYAESDEFGQLLLLRNSWGDDWADKGHAWISRHYYENYAERCLFFQ